MVVHQRRRHRLIVIAIGLILLWGIFTPGWVAEADNGPHGNYTPTTDACAACHRAHTAPQSRLLVNSTPALCYSCHGSAGLGADTNVVDGLYLDRDLTAESPTEGVANRGLRGGGFSFVLMDSDQDGIATSRATTSAHDGNRPTAWGNGAIGSGAGKTGFPLTCTTCHDPHGGGAYRSLRAIPLGSGAGTDVVVPDQALKTYSVTDPNNNYIGENYGALSAPLTDWCSQCHTRYDAPSGSGHTASGDPIFAYRHATDVVPCVRCHVAHGTAAVMTDPAGVSVLFPDGSSAANDNDRSSLLRLDERRVCFSCHVDPTNGLVNGGSCTTCHAQPQGTRRQITGAGGDFVRASHHVNGIPQDLDCTTCHEVGAHGSGTVNLKHADTGAVITFNANADLETFCLSCHDGNGAGGSPSFTDSVWPPVIDQTAWASASHNVSAPQTCYGSCHQNGHGSNLTPLLNPYDGTPGAGNVNQEEGFCYTCHDGSVATVNIQAEFARTYQHNISPNDPGGEYLECVNCHNPHLANSTNKLANPDTGATTIWTGTQEDFCLTCHDGNPPAGITFPVTSTGTGFDKSTFVNSSHDNNVTGPDGTLGDSCRACHAQHGSDYRANLLAQYVVQDYNPYTYPDADYAICWTCHDENQTIYGQSPFGKYDKRTGLFKENLHKKHVERENAPCIICHDVHAPHDAGESGLISFEYAVQNGYDIQYIGGYDASSAFWISADNTTGYCYIRCHGKDHTPKNYQRMP